MPFPKTGSSGVSTSNKDKLPLPADRADDALTPRGLQRRLKRRLLGVECRFFAVCTPGLEHICAAELALIPAVAITAKVAGGIEFTAPFEAVYPANLLLRTALRILLRIDTFTACSYPELYNKCRRIRWELYTGFSACVGFEATAKKSRLHHAGHVAKAVFDAVRDSMKAVGVSVARDDDAAIRFFVRMHEDICTISIDTSGELLYKRGYHAATAKAPLRETIAAALLMAAHWERYACIADPLCGSGTFVIEAALMARTIAPGAHRAFAFESWPGFDAGKWERIKTRAATLTASLPNIRLLASDLNEGALRAARANAERAGVAGNISFTKADCRDFNANGQLLPPGLIIANLPFGKRIGTIEGNAALCRDFGNRLRQHCGGWDYAFIASDEAYIRALGLRVTQRLPFSTGGIDVALVMGRL
jgi:putative N6-adenine-specific DNA methylase